MKKKHRSLLRRMLLFLITVMVCTLVVIAFLRTFTIVNDSKEHVATVTQQAASQVDLLVNGNALELCLTQPDHPDVVKLREQLHQLCVIDGLQYLYIYIPDFDQGTVTYVMAASSDEQLHASLPDARPAGTVTKLEPDVLEANRNAWNGSGDNQTRYANDMGDVTSSFYAITDGEENIAIVGADFDSKALIEESLSDLLVKMLVSVTGTLILFLILGLLAKKKIIDPIFKVSNTMRDFATNIDCAQFDPLRIDTGDEIQMMADSFNTMAMELRSHIDAVKALAAAEATVNTELSVARQIQESIVAPKMDLRLSDGLQISARLCSARQVGGDLYDCFQLPNGQHCVVIGDVSGKGIGAAMFMMMVKAILHEKLLTSPDLSQALSAANDGICQNNAGNMFATVFIATVDPKGHRLCYVNAGHNPPILIRDGRPQTLPGESGIVLGVFEDMDFPLETVEFQPSDALFLYTDGVTDCVDENNGFFGEEGLSHTLEEAQAQDAAQLCDRVMDALAVHRQQAEQFDDVTMLCIIQEKT